MTSALRRPLGLCSARKNQSILRIVRNTQIHFEKCAELDHVNAGRVTTVRKRLTAKVKP
jgi:hypothetical protein